MDSFVPSRVARATADKSARRRKPGNREVDPIIPGL